MSALPSVVSATYGPILESKFSMHCPTGTYITRIFGRVGQMADAISVECSNGAILGPYGGSRGGPFEGQLCSSGVSSVLVYYSNNELTGIYPYCIGGASLSPLGSSAYSQYNATFDCPNNYYLTKIDGSYGGLVSGVSFTCEKLGKISISAFTILFN